MAVAIGLSGCGGGSKATTIIVVPGYEKGFIINASVAVVILDKEPEIIYLGDAKKSLASTDAAKNTGRSATPEALIWNYFTDRLVQEIVREVDVKDAFIAEIGHHYRITREMVNTLDESIAVEIPDIGTRFTFDGREETALVLFLDRIRLGTDTDPYFLERAQHGLSTTTGRRLIYMAAFTLWDNRENKPICYGRVKTIVPIRREEATVANWEEITKTFVRTIFEPTGFLKRQGRR
jgi:hypothetical protein